MPNRPDYEEDLDDIMSQILQGSTPARPLPPQDEPKPTPRPAKRRRPLHLTHPITHPTPVISQKPAKKRRKKTNFKPVARVFIWLAILALGGFAGYLLYTGPLGAILGPSSPFTKQVKEQNGFKLYYPTALPNGYSISKESVVSPKTGVIVYSIDSSGKHIAVSQQAIPDGLNLSNLLRTYTGVKHFKVDIGTADVGIQDDQVTIVAHVQTQTTWLIISTDIRNINRDDFETIIKSLKQG